MQETYWRGRLAPEVLSAIFDLAVLAARSDPTDGPQQRVGLRSHPVDPTTPLILSHICKEWRSIAFSTSVLWSTIYITNPAPGHIPLLLLWLDHSKTHLLKVVIQDDVGFSSHHAEAVARVLSIFATHSKRWRSFKIKISHLTPPIPLQDVAESLLRVETPQLRSLAFTFATEASYTTTLFNIAKHLLVNSPQLVETHFWNDVDYKPELLSLIPFDRLKMLNLVLVTLSLHCRIVEVLPLFKCLDTLSVSLDNFNFHIQPHRIASLPTLRFLNVIDHEHSYKLVNILHLPGLKKFSLHIMTENRNAPDIYASIEQLWERSGCKLQDFALRDLRPEFSDRLLCILQKPALQSLTELRLGSDVGHKILQLLTIEEPRPDSVPDDFVLPALEMLHFEALSEDNTDTSLSEMVLSRMVAASITRAVARVAVVRAKFSSERKLQTEARFWDEHEKELGKIDRRWARKKEAGTMNQGELVFQDFSMVEGFYP